MPVHARAERNGVLDGQSRIERRIAVLEDHLRLLAEAVQAQRRRADRLAVEQDIALVRLDDLHDQPRGGGLAAARLAHDAERLALHDVEIDAVDRADHCPGARQQPAVAAEMLDQSSHRQQSRRLAAAIDVIERLHRVDDHAHCLTSIAERRPSENRLNEIEVRKIIDAGQAATIGWL